MEPKKLLEAAIEACGSDVEVAQRLGLSMSAANSSFGRWKRGENAPDYETTMQLLEIAGLLRQPEDLKRARDLAAQVEELQARLEEASRRRRAQ